jgi:hypothetical protein
VTGNLLCEVTGGETSLEGAGGAAGCACAGAPPMTAGTSRTGAGAGFSEFDARASLSMSPGVSRPFCSRSDASKLTRSRTSTDSTRASSELLIAPFSARILASTLAGSSAANAVESTENNRRTDSTDRINHTQPIGHREQKVQALTLLLSWSVHPRIALEKAYVGSLDVPAEILNISHRAYL